MVAATGRLDETYVDAFVPEPTQLSLGAMVARDVMDTDRLRAAAEDVMAHGGRSDHSP